jgi:LuxR family quorum-sensing transcriptional regulator LasR
MLKSCSIASFDAFVNAADESALIESTRRFAKRFGFDHFIYGVRISQPFTKSIEHICNGYPEDWIAQYNSNRYVELDPTIRHCLRSTFPLIWTDDLFEGPARVLWEEARAHGLSYGLSCPIHDRGGVDGMLSLARDKPLKMGERELTELIGLAQLLASFLHAGVSKIVVPELLQKNRPLLSERERECLKWAANGKSAWEISRILGISERTAVFHLSNAVQKLGVTNRTQAVARAVFLGLI